LSVTPKIFAGRQIVTPMNTRMATVISMEMILLNFAPRRERGPGTGQTLLVGSAET
jgi:hypothetical protein